MCFFVGKNIFFFIKIDMSENYNDFLLPENFEVAAKEYSKKLKNKGFVFVKLQEEEFDFLINEILVLFEKMKACLKRLNLRFDSQKLHSKIETKGFPFQERWKRNEQNV